MDRDFNYTTNGTFAVNLPNGSYQVNMDLGDTGPYLHDDMGIFLQGTQVDEVATAASQVVSKSYTVNVVNGQLDLLLKDLGGVDPNVCIECLSITILQVNHAPTVATAASATPSVVTGTTTSLSVLGADVDTGQGSLTYTWATTGTPPAAVSFSANGTNARKYYHGHV